MGLNTGNSNIFPTRNQTEGTTPATYDIDWTEERTQDISQALAVVSISTHANQEVDDPWTYNLTDKDTTTFFGWGQQAGSAGAGTSTLILDLGVDIHVHNTLIIFNLNTVGVPTDNTLTTSYSNDNVTYTQIDTTTNATADSVNYEHSQRSTKYRYLKFVYETEGDDQESVKIYQVRLVR